MNKKQISAYMTIEEDVPTGAAFEQKWYERCIMVLIKIRSESIDPVASHKLLLKIVLDLTWIKHNLNPDLPTDYTDTLVKLIDSSIELINGSLVDKNLGYLDIVIKSLKVIASPYENKV